MMKKSQILAAIALAMALGVVAPVVSVENASAADPAPTPSTTDAAKAAQSEIKDIKASFGPITTYAAGVETELKGSAAYGFYASAAPVVKDASEFMNNLKKDSSAGSVAGAIRTAIGDLSAYNDIETVKNITSSANKWSSANLATTIENAKVIAGAIKSSVKEGDDDYETATKKAEAIEALVADKAVKDRINGLIKGVAGTTDSGLDKLNTLCHEVVKDATVVIEDEASLNTVLAAVQGKLPQLALYNRINKQVAKVEKAIQDGNSDKTINGYLATLKKLVNGEIDQDQADKENEANKPGVNAPATGIAGTAEGTATTVSIVAGLATALTALGAGVVAYRSARRK